MKQPAGFEPTETRQPGKAARAKAHTETMQAANLISRVVYAVLVIGFIGYYLDKALAIVRQ